MGIRAIIFIHLSFFSCSSEEWQHERRVVEGPGKFERFHTPMFGKIKAYAASDDTLYSQTDDYLVWGELAAMDTRNNRSDFDEFFCANLPSQKHLDTISLYIMNFFAGCSVSNSESITNDPEIYDDHSSVWDRLRSYEVRYGRLKGVYEVFNYQQYPEAKERDYKIYCLPVDPADF